jgi:hypothetical protein
MSVKDFHFARPASRTSVKSTKEEKKSSGKQLATVSQVDLKSSQSAAMRVWKRKSQRKSKIKGNRFKTSAKGRSIPMHPALKNFIKTAADMDPTDEGYQAGLSMASSLISDPGQIYGFRLSRYQTHTTSVGGVLALSLNNDPSTWSEYSSLTALFSQIRIRRATLHVIRAFQNAVGTTTSGGNWQPIVYNALYDEVAAPTSYDSCIDSPNFKVFNHNFSTSNTGGMISLDFTGALTPLWADVSSPQSSSLYQGCPGCFQIYADGQSVSTVVIASIQVLDLEFMNRF